MNLRFRLSARNRGVALITVVVLMTMALVLLLALFGTTQSELKNSVSSADSSLARQQADTAIHLVIGQLSKAIQQNEAEEGREIWVTQPGMVRQYAEDGRLLLANKLYSSRKMRETSEADIEANEIPLDWNTRTAHYVDLNEPSLRQDAATGKARTVFPILDPRAFGSSSTTSVEEFTYSDKVSTRANAGTLSGVVLPGADADQQRVPMPVEWLYVLKDGTLGYLNERNIFVGSSGERATHDNPITSRIAFWADDETCKININTAGEGTYWDVPRTAHQRSADWALYQPMMHEFQRYPGHVASVCMSTVLFPGIPMNPPRGTTEFAKALEVKEILYDLMPKLLPGGSTSGSIRVPPGRNFSPTDFSNVQTALGERLFATTDDFLLRPNINASGVRDEIDFGSSSMWSSLPKADVIERLRFFLTPRSRASDLNPYGMPKISMWPVHVINGDTHRTVYDRTLVQAATLGQQAYYFTRRQCNSPDELDESINPRNAKLYQYLRELTSRPVPGFGNGASFLSKYGDNRDAILVSIFDYIRSTNLHDDNLVKHNLGTEEPAVTIAPVGRINAYTDEGGLKGGTFTPLRSAIQSGENTWPGHGQVVPTTVSKSDGNRYRGMGRFATISEAAIQFICCAQGTDRAGGKYAPKLTASAATAPTWRDGDPNAGWGDSEIWYSNFPPLSNVATARTSGFYASQYPEYQGRTGAVKLDGSPSLESDRAGTAANHPGYTPRNWNWTLDRDTPLPPNTKRIQATIVFEWFIPSAGWTLINPDFQFEVDASKLTLNGERLFKSNEPIVVKPRQQINNGWANFKRGGTTPHRGFMASHSFPARSKGKNGSLKGSLPDDTSYFAIPSGTPNTVVEFCNRYDLVSEFIDIPADAPMNFGGGEVTVTLRAVSRSSDPGTIYQTVRLNYPSDQFNPPELVTKTKVTVDGSHPNPTPAPYWWAFHVDGALGRSATGAFQGGAGMGGRSRYLDLPVGVVEITSDAIAAGNANSDWYYCGNVMAPEDTIQSLVIGHGDARLIMGQFEVPPTEFVPHRLYGRTLSPAHRRHAHNIIMRNEGRGIGIDRGTVPLVEANQRFMPNASFYDMLRPDIPMPQGSTGDSDDVRTAVSDIRKFGDFDRPLPGIPDGAYVNKPDEGNFYSIGAAGTIPYFSSGGMSYTGGATYFSPNRQISSSGMLGSLPTGIWGTTDGASRGQNKQAWRTLLFRPQTWLTDTTDADKHPGAPATLRWGTVATGNIRTVNVGGEDPPDHLLMELFWMPMVEPYAISQAGSTAGKVNLNYRMEPFRHIRRATGLAGAMKSEVVHSIPNIDAERYTGDAGADASISTVFNETTGTNGNKFWHREIDVEATLKLFDEKLSGAAVFLSPSQICEMPLLPVKGGYLGAPAATVARDNAAGSPPDTWADNIDAHLDPSNPDGMMNFWANNTPTADNLREKPYANLYSKVTTRSNTFQVHLRAQVIRKARSSDPAKFEENVDSIAADYRGSAHIERHLDMNHPELVGLDYASGDLETLPSLDQFHRFRIVNHKRFQ
jgi:uncharacterized protein (TIGR02600 family)